MTVKVEGLRELNRALRAVPAEYRKAQKEIHRKTAEPVAKAAKPLAPNQTGRLEQSIRALGSQRAGTVAAGGARLPYAPPIHWGWPARNIAPQPFLVDALEAREEMVVDIYFRETDRLIDRVWNREIK
jgi:hypothetical protein